MADASAGRRLYEVPRLDEEDDYDDDDRGFDEAEAEAGFDEVAGSFDEPTRVGPIDRETIDAMMRAADLEEESHRSSAPAPSRSGFRLIGGASEAHDAVAAAITIPGPFPVPIIRDTQLDPRELARDTHLDAVEVDTDSIDVDVPVHQPRRFPHAAASAIVLPPGLVAPSRIFVAGVLLSIGVTLFSAIGYLAGWFS